MSSLNIAVTRETLRELDELKKQFEKELGFKLSYNKTILYLIKRYKELCKSQKTL